MFAGLVPPYSVVLASLPLVLVSVADLAARARCYLVPVGVRRGAERERGAVDLGAVVGRDRERPLRDREVAVGVGDVVVEARKPSSWSRPRERCRRCRCRPARSCSRVPAVVLVSVARRTCSRLASLPLVVNAEVPRLSESPGCFAQRLLAVTVERPLRDREVAVGVGDVVVRSQEAVEPVAADGTMSPLYVPTGAVVLASLPLVL